MVKRFEQKVDITTHLGTLFNSPTWNNGVDDDRVAIVEDGSAGRGRVLEIAFPDNTFSPTLGGAQWRVRLPGSYEELYLAYWVKFAAGFDFVRGQAIWSGWRGGKHRW